MGKVHRSVTIMRHNFLAGSMMDDLEEVDVENVEGYKSSYVEFNSRGNLVKEIIYTTDEIVEQLTVCKYNDNGHLIEEIMYDGEDEINERKTYEVDDKGKILKKFIHYQDETFDTVHYEYDSENRLIEKHTVNAEGEHENKEVFSYDKGNLVREAEYDNEGTLLRESTWKYDEKGNETETTKWDVVDDNKIRTVIDYFDNGDREKVLIYNKEEQLVEKIVYEEDDKGRLLKMVEETPYALDTTEFVYDERDNVIEQVETNRNGEINNKIIRVYDENNEVIESTVFIDKHGMGVNQHYKVRYMFEEF